MIVPRCCFTPEKDMGNMKISRMQTLCDQGTEDFMIIQQGIAESVTTAIKLKDGRGDSNAVSESNIDRTKIAVNHSRFAIENLLQI